MIEFDWIKLKWHNNDLIQFSEMIEFDWIKLKWYNKDWIHH